MKFGIFYEHQLPRPWDEHSEYRLLQNSLDQIELADRLGYDYAWEVEHHFLEEYSHSSAPEVFLAAASQRTKRIRLGHGIIQLTTNHPARVAERVSTLDLVSHGRVELGIGEGSSVTELHPFDRRFRDKREVWEDAVRALIPMFGAGRRRVPRHALRLPAAQRAAEAAAEAAPAALGGVLAARHDRDGRAPRHGRARLPVRQRRRGAGVGALVLQRLHQAAREARRLPDEPERSRSSAASCAARPTRRRSRKADGWTFFAFALRFYASRPPVAPGTVNLWEEYQAYRNTPQGQKMHAGGLIGSPETIRDEAAQVRAVARRPGDPAEPGGPQHARGHLREPRAVRARGDAGVPRARRPSTSSGRRRCSPARSSSRRSTPRPRTCPGRSDGRSRRASRWRKLAGRTPRGRQRGGSA